MTDLSRHPRTVNASAFIATYWRGWYCATKRCQFFRPADSEGAAWCWLRSGIEAEGKESQCPAYMRHLPEIEAILATDESKYYTRPSRESAMICMAISLACMLVLGVIAAVIGAIK